VARVYLIATDGDDIEKMCWSLFLQHDFPSYQTVWQNRVTPVTTRPAAMGFKSDAELAANGMDQHDMCFIQLHYTVLVHLNVAYPYRAIRPLSAEDFTHAIVRLCSATDVADELLGRVASPGTYDPWSEDRGRDARYAWRKTHQQLQDVRNYRNHLIHGRIFMSVTDSMSGNIYFPKIGREQKYIDWRSVAHSNPAAIMPDYASGHDILEETWHRLVEYLESNWKAIP